MPRIVFKFPRFPGPVLRATVSICLILGIGVGSSVGLSGCAWLDVKQRHFVFRPTPGAPADFAGLRPGDLSFATAVPGTEPGTQDSLQMWWLPHANATAPTLLYLHGTFRNLYQNLPKIDALREAGFAVLAVDYRGWGDSTPITPSEATIYADADVAWAELTRRQPDPRKRVIYGHSMGGGVAVELASRKHHGTDYGALILESTFTSGYDVARETNWLVGLMARFSSQKFDSMAKIGKVDAPVLMLHGDADRTVPVALGRRLRDAAPPGTRWVEFPGGTHSRLQSDAPAAYQQALKLLIAELG
jgi:pimeloyl-ACP methyl ester carboxylesterase